MKNCHVCGFECDNSVELCPLCGADLSGAEETVEETEEAVIKNPVLLASFEDVVSAEIFKDILIDNNIIFSSSNNDSGSIRVVFGGGFLSEEIYVEESQFEDAQKLYDEFLNSEQLFEEDILED